MKIILASTSPRRKDLMDLAKIDYEIIASRFDEKVDINLSLQEQSKEIAYGKAKEVFEANGAYPDLSGCNNKSNAKSLLRKYYKEELVKVMGLYIDAIKLL